MLREAGRSLTGQRLRGRKPSPGELPRARSLAGGAPGGCGPMLLFRRALGLAKTALPSLLPNPGDPGFAPKRSEANEQFTSETLNHSGISRDEWDAQSQLLFLRDGGSHLGSVLSSQN